MRRHWIWATLLLAACEPPAPPPPSAGPSGPPAVSVVPVTSQKLVKPMKLSGELVARRDVALYARVQGFVEKIEVDRGSVVKQGQTLVQLVAPELEAQRHEAEAKLGSDLATYKRLKEASATPGVVSGNEVEVSEKVVEADRARVQWWKQNETYLKISAPFDGVITERNVHEGSLVSPSGAGSAAMLRIQEVATLRLVVPVPEIAAGSVTDGGVVPFTVPAFPGVSFSGTLARTSRALDLKTRSLPVELDVDNRDGRLAPGMFPEVQWQMKRSEPTLFVPPTSVVVTTERTFVIRVNGGKVEWVDVKLGVSTGPLQEVFGTLSAGDSVALRGSDELRAGTVVLPKEAPSPR
ncbi:MAG TPA: efflux RND transporter periplasmic adaptor subunit [Planctomycetota bacterium]|jgi:RND family efflux transporter MFP subunit|nr:efflux RND transporter periplasmic adaptor subunit [Planctomycetota bacterium]